MRALTVRELIIEVQQQVQRLGSYKRDKTSEPLIIWRLNTAQDRFIRDCIKPDPNQNDKFSINEESRTSIQALIETNKSLLVYNDISGTYSILPSNLAYLVNDRSIILPDCNAQFSSPSSSYIITATAIPFNESTKANAPYYSITATGSSSNSISYNLANKKESFEIIEVVANQLIQAGALDVYWESFNGWYVPNSFIAVHRIETGQSPPPTFGLTIDGVVSQTSVKNFTVNKFKSFSGNQVPNRSYKNDYVHDAVNYNYYDQPIPESPVTYLGGNKLNILTSKRFLVSEIILDYIRKPRRISLYLNQSCELDGSVHEKICSIATEMILSNIEAENYAIKVQENINRLD